MATEFRFDGKTWVPTGNEALEMPIPDGCMTMTNADFQKPDGSWDRVWVAGKQELAEGLIGWKD